MLSLLRDSASLRQPPRARGFAGFLPLFGGASGSFRRPGTTRAFGLGRLLGRLATAGGNLLPSGTAPGTASWRLPRWNRPERGVSQRPPDCPRHVADRSHAVDRAQRAFFPEILNERRGLDLV